MYKNKIVKLKNGIINIINKISVPFPFNVLGNHKLIFGLLKTYIQCLKMPPFYILNNSAINNFWCMES